MNYVETNRSLLSTLKLRRYVDCLLLCSEDNAVRATHISTLKATVHFLHIHNMGVQASKGAPTEAEKVIIDKDAPRMRRINDACAQTREMVSAFDNELARFKQLDATNNNIPIVDVQVNCEEILGQACALHCQVSKSGTYFAIIRDDWEPSANANVWRRTNPAKQMTKDLLVCSEQLSHAVHQTALVNFRWLQSCAARHVKAKTKPTEEWADLHGLVRDFRAKFEETAFVVLDEIALAFADLLEMILQTDPESQKLLAGYGSSWGTTYTTARI